MWSTSAILAALAALGITGTAAASFLASAGISGGISIGGVAVPNPSIGDGLPLLALVVAFVAYRTIAARGISARDAG